MLSDNLIWDMRVPRGVMLKKNPIYFHLLLKGRERKRQRERSFGFWFILQMPAAGVGPGGVRNRAPEFLHPSAMLPPGSREAGLLGEQVEAEAGTLVWDRAS